MSKKPLTPAKAARRALVADMRKSREAGIAVRKKRRVNAVKSAGQAASKLRAETRAQLTAASKELTDTSKKRATERASLKTRLVQDGNTRKKELTSDLKQAGQTRRGAAIADRQTRIAAFAKLVSEVPGADSDARRS